MRRNHTSRCARKIQSKNIKGRKAIEPLESRILLTALTWQVQSDYFGATTTVSQPRSLRGLAVSPSGNDIYGGFIQNPNTASATIREVSTAIQSGVIGDEVNTVPGTTPQTTGEDAFAQVGFQAKELAVDNRGYVYASLSNGTNTTNQFWGIYTSNLTQIVQEQSSDFIAARTLPGIATAELNGNYYVYIGWQNGQIERWNVNNPAVPVLDTSWGSAAHPGTIDLKSINGNFYLDSLAVDGQGNLYIAGGILGTTSFGDAIIKVPAAVAANNSATSGNTLESPVKGGADGNGGFASMGIALFAGNAYVTEYLASDSAIGVFNMSNLAPAGVITLPNPTGPSGFNATFPTGSDSGYSGIAISPTGQIYVAEQIYNTTSSSFSPNGTTAITGNSIIFDRIMVSSPLSLPVVSVVSGNNQATPINTTFGSDLSVQVTNGGLPLANYPVTFTAPATGASGTFSNNAATIVEMTDSNGDVSVPYTANGIVGSDDVTVSTPNAASPAVFDLTNTQISTATTVVSSINPSVYGQPVTFTATVTPSSGTFDNGGSVQFEINSVNFGAPVSLSGGTASVTDSALGASATAYAVMAVYSGDTDFGASLGSLSGGQTVNQTSPTISLAAGGTVTVGTGAKMTATATLSNSVNAGGSITFVLTGPSNTIVDTESDPVSGNGNYSTPTGFAPGVPGTYNWVASYGGDGNNAPAGPTPPASELAIQPVISVLSGNNQSTPINTTFPNDLSVQVTSGGVPEANVPVTFTAPATGASGTFSNNATTIVEMTDSNGDVSVPYTANGIVGSDDVTATTPNAASPAVFDLTNTQISTVTTVVSSINPSVYGQPVTFTATVTPSSGTFDNGGSVQFEINSVNFGAPVSLSGGTASVTDSALGASLTPYSVMAVFSGDTDFAASSGSLNGGQTVKQTSPSIGLSAGGTVAIGTGAKMTASATLSNSVNAGGSITFVLTGPSNTVVDTESAPVSGNSVYSTPTGFTPSVAGTYHWVASYSGDSNNAPAGPTAPASETATGTGLTLVGSTLYINGGNTNDQVNIQHIGQSNTGSTGIQISGQLNGVNINNMQFPVAPSMFIINLFNGNDTVNMEANLTIPASVTDGNGTDNIQLGQGNNSVTIGSGNDSITAGNGANTVNANTGAGQVKINLGNGNNTIAVTDTSAGQANIQLGTGNNNVSVGNGQDNIQAPNGVGTNTITAGNGQKDQVHVGNGNNTITLGDGQQDQVQAGSGNNSITLGNGTNDNVNVTGGSNTITLGNGAQDQVTTGDGSNVVSVGSGNGDNVHVGNGNNIIVLGSTGTTTGDVIQAGNGDNLLIGGLGQDNMTAGNGSNILIDGSVQLTQPNESLSTILAEWISQGSSSYSDINSRISVHYNSSNKDQLHAGSGLDWFWFTNNTDQVNSKPNDLRN